MFEDDLKNDNFELFDGSVIDEEANLIDAHIGARLKTRRLILGLSQEELALKTGIAFQQLQKYERGLTRITAGRLWDLARILESPIAYFYEGLDKSMGFSWRNLENYGEFSDVSSEDNDVNQKLDNVAYLFSCIPSLEVKMHLYELIKSMAVVPGKFEDMSNLNVDRLSLMDEDSQDDDGYVEEDIVFD